MPKGFERKRGSSAYNPIDVHVGKRLRTRRTLLGLTQVGLATAVGLRFQQLQKYERGANRISASRLYDLSQILHVDMAYFFDEMDETTQKASPAQISSRESKPSPKKPASNKDPLLKREALKFVRAYYRISDPMIRDHVRKLVQSTAASSRSS